MGPQLSRVNRHRHLLPDRFVAGRSGDGLHATFYIQARSGNRITNVVCGRNQLARLGEHLAAVVAEAAETGGVDFDASADRDPLDVPLEADFVAGTMVITWRKQHSRVRVELFEYGKYRHEDSSGAALDAEITLDQANDFVARTDQLLADDVIACPFCAQPLAAEGHVCPAANGYRRDRPIPRA